MKIFLILGLLTFAGLHGDCIHELKIRDGLIKARHDQENLSTYDKNEEVFLHFYYQGRIDAYQDLLND